MAAANFSDTFVFSPSHTPPTDFTVCDAAADKISLYFSPRKIKTGTFPVLLCDFTLLDVFSAREPLCSDPSVDYQNGYLANPGHRRSEIFRSEPFFKNVEIADMRTV